jgi:hypothetical protein
VGEKKGRGRGLWGSGPPPKPYIRVVPQPK